MKPYIPSLNQMAGNVMRGSWKALIQMHDEGMEYEKQILQMLTEQKIINKNGMLLQPV